MFRKSLLLLIMFAVTVLPLQAGSQSALWDKYNREGLKAIGERRLADAERSLGLALAEAEKFGQQDPRVGTVLNNLALLRMEQGKYNEADTYFNRALSTFSRRYGSGNSDIGTVLENLAVSYWRQGKYAEAEPLFKSCLAVYEGTLGGQNADFATSVTRVADFYFQQQKYEEAGPLYERALSIFEKSAGPDHPSVAIALDKLALFYQSEGRYKDAESLLNRALSITSKLAADDATRVKTDFEKLQKAKQRPNLIIERPRPGELFDDSPVLVKLNVENFELERPDLHFGEPAPRDLGHIHIMLDSYPLTATSTTQQMIGKMSDGRYLPRGKHTLVVELVHDTHGPLTPPVVRIVTFYTDHAEGGGSVE